MKKHYIPKEYSKKTNQIRNKKNTNIIILLLKLIIGLIFFGGIGYILYAPILNVSSFEIKVEDDSLQKNISSRAENLIKDETYWWYNNQNIFLLRSDSLEKYLLKEFPQIKNIYVKRNIMSQVLELNISLRTPVFNICENETCYYIDEDGVNMGENLEKSQEKVLLKGIFPKMPGELIASNREIVWLKTILQEYNKIDNIKITSIEVKQKFDNSIVSIYIYTEQGYYIMVDLDTDVVYQAQALKQVFISQIPIEKRATLEYIDLRVKDRIYYKFR